MIYLQSLFYYVIRHYDKRNQNFTNILRLIRLSNPNSLGVSKLDNLFLEWEKIEPDAIGVKQYKHFKVAAGTPKMMSTIIMTATARLAVFNIKEVHELTDDDDMELERIGMPLDDNDPLLKEIEDFYKAKNAGISNTQLYKQAGNSIVVNVLEYIFNNLFFMIQLKNASKKK